MKAINIGYLKRSIILTLSILIISMCDSITKDNDKSDYIMKPRHLFSLEVGTPCDE